MGDNHCVGANVRLHDVDAERAKKICSPCAENMLLRDELVNFGACSYRRLRLPVPKFFATPFNSLLHLVYAAYWTTGENLVSNSKGFLDYMAYYVNRSWQLACLCGEP